MGGTVAFHHDFRREFDASHEAVQDELLAMIERLEVAGPGLRRPGADTLEGSKHVVRLASIGETVPGGRRNPPGKIRSAD